MASASSRRSLDTDNITFRRVFAKLSDNRNPPAGYVLTGVGDAQTYWANPSTLGMLPTFNEIQADSYSFFPSSLLWTAGTGIVMSSLSTKSLELMGGVFGQVDISGSQSISAYSNFRVNGTLKVAGQGFISTVSDTYSNILYLSSTAYAPSLSTAPIGYHILKLNSTVTQPIDLTNNTGLMSLINDTFTMYPTLIGYKDFLLHPTFQPSQVQFELSSYSALRFLQISSLVGNNFSSILSTIDNIYVDKVSFSTAMRSLSSTTGYYNVSTISTISGFSNITQVTYDIKMGETLARATIIQLNDVFKELNTGLSTISSVKTPLFVMFSTNSYIFDTYSSPKTAAISTLSNFTAGSIYNFTISSIYTISTQLSTLSTQIDGNLAGFSNTTVNNNIDFIEALKSTNKGLGTIGYVSSSGISFSFANVGSTGDYISTKNLTSSFNGLSNLGYVNQFQYLSAFSTNYTIYPTPTVLNTSLRSTTQGVIQYAPYISSLSMTSSIVSTTKGTFTQASEYYIQDPLLITTLQSTSIGMFEYTAEMYKYISTASLNSTLISTVGHLANINYISSASLISSLTSTLNGIPFLNSASLASTIDGSNEYLRTYQLQSTVQFYEGWRGVFTSSIPYQGTSPYESLDWHISSVELDPSNYNLYGQFSTMSSFLLASFSPYVRDQSKVVLEYLPSFITSAIDPMASGYKYNIITELRHTENTKQVDNSFYTTCNYLQTNSNLFNDKITLAFSGSEFRNFYDKPLTFFHSIEFIGSNESGNYTYFFNQQKFTNLTPQKNSLFVSIYN